MYTDNEAHIQVQVPIYTMSSSSDVKKSKQLKCIFQRARTVSSFCHIQKNIYIRTDLSPRTGHGT